VPYGVHSRVPRQSASNPTPIDISIDLGRGRVVRVEVEFDADVLSRVLDVLKAR
jgi:hypothetical protein